MHTTFCVGNDSRRLVLGAMLGGTLGSMLLLLVGTPAPVEFALTAEVMLFLLWVRHERSLGGQLITIVGTFAFSFLLFFAARPLFIIVENDHSLFQDPFHIAPTQHDLNVAATACLLALASFFTGATLVFPRTGFQPPRVLVPSGALAAKRRKVVLLSGLGAQCVSVVLLLSLGLGVNRGNLSEVTGSAYLYFIPNALQSVHLCALVTFMCFRRQIAHLRWLAGVGVAVVLLLVYTYLLRNVSNFRGYYLVVPGCVGLACLLILRRRISYIALAVLLLIVMPVFSELGHMRAAEARDVVEYLKDNASSYLGLSSVWLAFQGHGGDFNCFDTFVAALSVEPQKAPYLWTWIYTLIHWIPRAVWSSKPELGVTVDVSHTNGAPYSAGLHGFYYLDGGGGNVGFVWMAMSMCVWGMIAGSLDRKITWKIQSWWTLIVYAVLLVNSLFAVRFFMFQTLYQVLYMLFPCLLFQWAFRSVLEQPRCVLVCPGASADKTARDEWGNIVRRTDRIGEVGAE